MPRLNPKQKSEILTDYVSGKSQSEIARKFKVSVTTISKILKNAESLKNANKSLNREQLGNSIIEKAVFALHGKDFNDMHPETLLKIIERLSLLYNAENGTPNGKKAKQILFAFRRNFAEGYRLRETAISLTARHEKH